jgi:hypothetical protein
MVIPFYDRRDPDGAANKLMQEAAERWQREQGMIDDITIIVVFLNINNDNKVEASILHIKMHTGQDHF